MIKSDLTGPNTKEKKTQSNFLFFYAHHKTEK